MLGRNGAVLVTILGAAMASRGMKAPIAARSFLLLEILTASSFLKDLREHLHAATGSALLLGHLVLQDATTLGCPALQGSHRI